ncbi:MAG: LysR family transcriptional regulator [Pseudomonadota bacterium]
MPALNRHSRQMDWNLLHTFVVLADSDSITDAAERLGRRQPTISSALNRLERQLGRKLIDRSPGRFELTSAGRLLYQEAVDIYGAVGRLGTLMREVTDEVRGHVRIVMASHVICPLFDTFLETFHKRYPAATLSLDVMSSAAAQAETRARRASLALCLTDCSDAALTYVHIYREFFGLFCGPSHSLFGREGLELSDLRGHSSVSFATDRLDDVLRPVALVRAEAGLDQRIVATSSHLEEVRRATLSGLGIGALPLHVAKRDVDEDLLWRLPPYVDPPMIDVHLAYNPRARLNRAEQAFRDGFVEAIAATPLAERTYDGSGSLHGPRMRDVG